VRLCSEDAAQDFMPQSGRMALWQVPDGIRVEHALQSGTEIPPFYDSMIAKVIVTHSDRESAIIRMNRALDEFLVEGVQTTISFQKKVLLHDAFRYGDVTTNFIAKHIFGGE
jgi:geranyl-CoA carboxylase alpha subunit